MSIHGVQRRLIFNLNENNKQQLIYEAALAANFSFLADRVEDGEKLLNFSEIMWPFLFIQGEPNNHVMIDEVGINNMALKIANAPRSAQIGHVLRDPNMDRLKKLNLAHKIAKFEEKIKIENIKEEVSSEEEYIQRDINGLVNAKLIEGFSQILSTVFDFQMSDFSSLETFFSFDDGLNFAKKFKETLELSRGNGIRWHTLIKLIEEPVSKWILDLKVEIKDIEERSKIALQKAKELDEKSIIITMDSAKDNMEQWVLKEQKNIIGKIGRMFVGIDLIFEEARNENKIFLDTDSLKREEITTVLKKAFQNVAFLRSSLANSEQKLNELSEKLNVIRQEIENKSLTAEERIKKLNSELLDKKQEQENAIQRIKNERDSEIRKIQQLLDQFENIMKETMDYINRKIEDCRYDEENLRKWQIHDSKSHIANPTMRYFIPVGMALIQNGDGDERIEIVFPSYIGRDLERTALCPDLNKLEKDLSKILDKNMKIRSNFEFTLEKKNIKNDPKMKQSIKTGFDILIKENCATVEQQIKYSTILEKM